MMTETVQWELGEYKRLITTYKEARLEVNKFRGDEYTFSVYIEGEPLRFGFRHGLECAKLAAIDCAKEITK
jgi:hypothetical protein